MGADPRKWAVMSKVKSSTKWGFLVFGGLAGLWFHQIAEAKQHLEQRKAELAANTSTRFLELMTKLNTAEAAAKELEARLKEDKSAVD